MKEFFYALLYSLALFVAGYGTAHVKLADCCKQKSCPCTADCCKKKPQKPCCPPCPKCPDCPPQGALPK